MVGKSGHSLKASNVVLCYPQFIALIPKVMPFIFHRMWVINKGYVGGFRWLIHGL